MGRKEKTVLAIGAVLAFLVIMGKGYGIWAVAGILAAYWLYQKRK